MNTRQHTLSWRVNIITYIREKDHATVKELVEFLGISPSLTHRYLKILLEEKTLHKVGSAPRVFYVLTPSTNTSPSALVATESVLQHDKETIDTHFLHITPQGERLAGWEGFVVWCASRQYDSAKKAKEYVDTFQKYEKFRKNGLLDGTSKLTGSFKQIFVDQLYYIDFYAWEVFGKTKLGQLLLYAKQSQDVGMIREITDIARPHIAHLVQTHHLDALGYIPPTVKREVQFMQVFKQNMRIELPSIAIEKAVSGVRVPQKTLTKLEDRVENARETFFVTDRRAFATVLLIDDAVGSGATLNEVARKIKKQGVAERVIGLAITGSAKGFDVISEV